MPSKIRLRATFTRPTNTTAYTANDVVGDSASALTPMEFPGLVRGAGGSGFLIEAMLTTNQASFTEEFRVHLFRSSSVTLPNDNAAMAKVYADDANYIGSFDFDAMVSEGADVSRIIKEDLRKAIVAASDSSTIYAILETLGGFTPASGVEFALTLTVELDP